jgi:cation transport regulator ChaC
MKGHYYFAYGSCMSLKDIRRTTPAEFVAAATLFDHKLAFTRYSHGRQGGVADVVQSVGDYVEGVLFKVYDLKALDRREGHPTAYRRRKVKVMVKTSKGLKFVSVWTYEVVRKEAYEIQPSESYQRLIREGARSFLSLDYQIELEANLKRFRAPYELPEADDWELWKDSLHERLGTV